uniref:Uncharacterized protein n=1 Tax=Anguilla anguilla TaxID=7936 RepID=A0A0E9R630_ANGAN
MCEFSSSEYGLLNIILNKIHRTLHVAHLHVKFSDCLIITGGFTAIYQSTILVTFKKNLN